MGALVSRGQAGTERQQQCTSVLVAHHTVQQEVTRCIHSSQEVEDVAKTEHDRICRTVLLRSVKDVDHQHDGSWGLADNKENDNCNQCGCDLIFLPLAAAICTVSRFYLLKNNSTINMKQKYFG